MSRHCAIGHALLFCLSFFASCKPQGAGPDEGGGGRPNEESAVFPAIETGYGGAYPGEGENPWLGGWGAVGGSRAASEVETQLEKRGSAPIEGDAAEPGSPGHVNEQPKSDVDRQGGRESEALDEMASGDRERMPPLLFLSEYKEGSGSDKRLKITNRGSGVEGSCQILVYANGSAEPWRRISVEPIPEPAASLTLCTEREASESFGCQATLSGSPFNGNDAIEVRCDGKLVDSFGQVGFDPGQAWEASVGELSTKDQWLVRCDATPDLDSGDVFSIELQWGRVSDAEGYASGEACSSVGQGGAGGTL